MLPGQVENWIFLSNAKGLGIAHVAVAVIFHEKMTFP